MKHIPLISRKKTPDFLQAWFACEKLPPGVYFLEKDTCFFTSVVCLWSPRCGHLGVVNLGVVNLGVVNLGVVNLGVVNLGVVNLGVVT